MFAGWCSAPASQPWWWGESLGSIFTLIAVWTAVNSCRAEGDAWRDSTCPAPLPAAAVSPKPCWVKTHTGVVQFVLMWAGLGAELSCWCDSKATGVTLSPVCSLGWNRPLSSSSAHLGAAGTTQPTLLCGLPEQEQKYRIKEQEKGQCPKRTQMLSGMALETTAPRVNEGFIPPAVGKVGRSERSAKLCRKQSNTALPQSQM